MVGIWTLTMRRSRFLPNIPSSITLKHGGRSSRNFNKMTMSGILALSCKVFLLSELITTLNANNCVYKDSMKTNFCMSVMMFMQMS